MVDHLGGLIRGAEEVSLGNGQHGWRQPLLITQAPGGLTVAELRAYAVQRYPDLPFLPDKNGRAPTSTWRMVTVAKHPRSRLTLQIKPENGNVDLYFAALPIGELRTLVSNVLRPGADTVEFPAAWSRIIRHSLCPRVSRFRTSSK